MGHLNLWFRKPKFSLMYYLLLHTKQPIWQGQCCPLLFVFCFPLLFGGWKIENWTLLFSLCFRWWHLYLPLSHTPLSLQLNFGTSNENLTFLLRRKDNQADSFSSNKKIFVKLTFQQHDMFGDVKALKSNPHKMTFFLLNNSVIIFEDRTLVSITIYLT